MEIDYDPLPAVVDLRAAASDEVLVFADVGTNTTDGFGLDEEFDEHLFDDCEVVVTREIVNQRLAACAAGGPGRRGGLGRGRAGHPVVLHAERAGRRDEVAGWLGVDAAQVHVIAPDVGGGFGAKIGADPEFALVAWLAKHTRPAGPLERDPVGEPDRDDARAAAQLQTITIGGNRDGDVLAYRLDVLADAGAYPRSAGCCRCSPA